MQKTNDNSNQSKFKNVRFIQPRSKELGSFFARPCWMISTSHQLLLLLLMLRIFMREPNSASPMASVSLFGPARRFTSVVVTAWRPTSGDDVVVVCGCC